MPTDDLNILQKNLLTSVPEMDFFSQWVVLGWDNAAAETFFATLKNEMYHQQVFTTRARARFAVAEYIEVFYNRRRLHPSLGYRTPAQTWDDHHQPAATDLPAAA